MASDEDECDRTGRPGWSGGARLAAAAVLVVALGAAAVVATVSHPARLGVAFSGGAQPPPVTGAAGSGGAGAAESGRVGAAESDRAGVAEGGRIGAEAAADELLTAPLGDRRRADFELVDGLTTVELRVADLGDDLYRIGTPPGAGVTPHPEVRGDLVRVRMDETGGAGPAAVRVLFNSRAIWRLRLVGGVDQQVLDLGAARLAGVELIGGSSGTRLRLPTLTGSLTVRMTGGVHDLAVTMPGGAPVRVRVGAGAGAVAVYQDRRDGVAAGELISSPDWDRANARLNVDLVAGANTVTVAEG